MIAGSDYTIKHYLTVFHAAKNIMDRDYNTWTHLSREQVIEKIDKHVNKPNCFCSTVFIADVVDLIIKGKNA